MNSKYIKYALLRYYRFDRQMIAGTEVGVSGGFADILAISEDLNKSIEVEVKISKADFKREFKDKLRKHQVMNLCSATSTPNYYYFAFPKELAEELIHVVPNDYGVIKIYNYNEVKVLRQGKRLNHTDNKILYKKLVKRLSSELIGYYRRYEVGEN